MPIAVQMIATAIANRGCTVNTASPAIEAVASTMNWPNPPVFAPTITLTTTAAASAASATVLDPTCRSYRHQRYPTAGTIGCTTDTMGKRSGRRPTTSATTTVHARPTTPARR